MLSSQVFKLRFKAYGSQRVGLDVENFGLDLTIKNMGFKGPGGNL